MPTGSARLASDLTQTAEATATITQAPESTEYFIELEEELTYEAPIDIEFDDSIANTNIDYGIDDSDYITTEDPPTAGAISANTVEKRDGRYRTGIDALPVPYPITEYNENEFDMYPSDQSEPCDDEDSTATSTSGPKATSTYEPNENDCEEGTHEDFDDSDSFDQTYDYTYGLEVLYPDDPTIYRRQLQRRQQQGGQQQQQQQQVVNEIDIDGVGLSKPPEPEWRSPTSVPVALTRRANQEDEADNESEPVDEEEDVQDDDEDEEAVLEIDPEDEQPEAYPSPISVRVPIKSPLVKSKNRVYKRDEVQEIPADDDDVSNDADDDLDEDSDDIDYGQTYDDEIDFGQVYEGDETEEGTLERRGSNDDDKNDDKEIDYESVGLIIPVKPLTRSPSQVKVETYSESGEEVEETEPESANNEEDGKIARKRRSYVEKVSHQHQHKQAPISGPVLQNMALLCNPNAPSALSSPLQAYTISKSPTALLESVLSVVLLVFIAYNVLSTVANPLGASSSSSKPKRRERTATWSLSNGLVVLGVVWKSLQVSGVAMSGVTDSEFEKSVWKRVWSFVVLENECEFFNKFKFLQRKSLQS
jgi:hypothetical protein